MTELERASRSGLSSPFLHFVEIRHFSRKKQKKYIFSRFPFFHRSFPQIVENGRSLVPFSKKKVEKWRRSLDFACCLWITLLILWKTFCSFSMWKTVLVWKSVASF